MWKLIIGKGNENPWLTSVNGHIGRQYWEFDPEAGMSEEQAEVERVRSEFHRNRLTNRQSSDHLIRMQIIVLHITGDLTRVLSPEHLKEIKRYTYNHQNEDGGWGFYIDGHSTMFGTTLNYIALRLLGVEANAYAMLRGRDWILDHGGLTCIPSWGKFWLTILGLYEWEGCNPMPPEFWLLPNIFPIHPGKMLCYCRLVYMPMSYLYGRRFAAPITELIQSLRKELHTQPYHEIEWSKFRNSCAKEDLYYPHPLMQDMLWGFLHYVGEPVLNSWLFKKVRNKAMKKAMEHVHYEDINSRYFCIGCVEKVLCLIACWVEDPYSDAYKKHLARVPDYLWLAEDGMKMQGFGSHMWDEALAIQAILRSGLAEDYALILRKAHDFLKASQVRENPSGNFKEMYRHISKGCWTFATQDHGWQVSDCTAEGLKAALLLSQLPLELVGEKLQAQHIYDAVNIILSLQSANGGYPAWEPNRAFRWLEKLNPTEFFEDNLIEREHIECTSSAILALKMFKKLYPKHRRAEIERCITKGLTYIEETQNLDGSWYGFWGICYTYGAWFGAEALAACGRNYHNCLALRKACKFLLSKQLPDGGWGESTRSCKDMVYTNLEGNRSNLVQTSWAILALIKGGQGDVDLSPIERGVRLLINSQMEDGNFPQQVWLLEHAWFAVEALTACGRKYKNSVALQKACEFLLSKQLSDGGWGESCLSCSNKIYTNIEGNRSNLVQTSWAILALIKAGQGDVNLSPIERGVRLLINSQMLDGDFPQPACL